jgi:hypothetical protein
MRQTKVTIELGKEDLRLAATSVIEYLTLYPPFSEERSVGFDMGVQLLFDVLKSTFKDNGKE